MNVYMAFEAKDGETGIFCTSSWAWYLLHTAMIWVHLCYYVTILAVQITKPPFKACLNQQRNWIVHIAVKFRGSDLVWTQLASELQCLSFSDCLFLSVFLSPSVAYAFPCMTFISQKWTFIAGIKKVPSHSSTAFYLWRQLKVWGWFSLDWLGLYAYA